jgi:hypothetical protein
MTKKAKMPTMIDPTMTPEQGHTSELLKITEAIKQANANNKPMQGTPYDFSKVHVGIGLPCYGGMMCTTTTTSLIRFILLATQVGLMWSLETMCNESLVQRGRNSLMAKLAANPAVTHFMFIDADIEFQPDSILRMLAEDVDIISGAYPKKALPIAYNINLEKETLIRGPIYTVDTAATGFLLYKRKVWQDLVDAMPETKYRDDIGLGKQYEPFLYSIFDCYIDEAGHYLSEDWAFCRRAKKLGYKIWCDSRVTLNHTGTYTFKGDSSLVALDMNRAVPVTPPTVEVPVPIITETEK